MSGHESNALPMTPAELGDHLARLGGRRLALAHAVGCGRSTLYRWLSGARAVPAAAAERIRGLTPPLPPEPAAAPKPRLKAKRKSGRNKTVAAMTRCELARHKVRVGGEAVLLRTLPCAHNTVWSWSTGRRNISASWAARIRAVPDAVVAHPVGDDRQLPFPFMAEAAQP